MKETQFKEIEPDMAKILELSEEEFKTIMVNTLRALMDKIAASKNRWAI